MPTHKQQPPTRATSNPNEHVRLALESPRENQLQLYAAGSTEPMSKAERAALLKSVRAGEPAELEFEAVAFIQRDTPNRNFVRFQAGALPSFAKSFEGQPFLMNHDHYDVASRGGTILASKLEHNDDGSKQMRMRVKAVKPWAVEGLLDGTIDRFSIAWDRNGAAYVCSIHELSLYSCDKCWVGRTEKESGKIAEVLIKGSPVGTEMSGVNVPAVVGTSVVSIAQLATLDRAQLADILGRDATGSDPAPDPHEDHDMKNLPALAVALGLSVTATEDEVVAAAERQSSQLKISEAASKLAKEENERLALEESKRAATAHAKHVDDAIAQLLAAGKIKPNDPTEQALRSLAKQGPAIVAVFDASVESLKSIASVTPVGAVLPGATPDPKPGGHATTVVAQLATLNEGALKQLRAQGLTDEQINKHAASAVEHVNAKEMAGLR